MTVLPVSSASCQRVNLELDLGDRKGTESNRDSKYSLHLLKVWPADPGILLGVALESKQRFLLKNVNASAIGRLRVRMISCIVRLAHFKFGMNSRVTAAQASPKSASLLKCSSF